MILNLIKYEQGTAQVIHGVNNFIKKFLLSNYSLTKQIIIINFSTAFLALSFLIIFNLFLLNSNNNLEKNNRIIVEKINQISSYLSVNAVKRIMTFDESCNSVSEGTNRESARITCNENNLLDKNYKDQPPQLDPTYTEQYVYSNFLNTSLQIKVFDSDWIKIVDTDNHYNIKDEVVISDIDEKIQPKKKNKLDFYKSYKTSYFLIFNKIKKFFDEKKFNKNIKNKNIIKIHQIEDTNSYSYKDKEGNFKVNFISPVLKDDKIYGVVSINSLIVFDDYQGGTLSFLLTNFFFFFISIMFSLSFLFSKSIVNPIKKLSQNTNLERDKLFNNKEIIKYLNRNDEIGTLSDDIRSMSIDLKKRIIEMEEFALDVSHELKNPLAGLKSSNDLLKTKKINEPNKILLIENMGIDIDRMNILITDIANYSLTGVEISEEAFEEVELINFLNDFINSFRYKDLIEIKSNLKSIYITVNKNKFLQVIHNLLDNAITFIPLNSKILICAKVENKKCIIHFVDRGPGVLLDYKEKIFERFYKDRRQNNNSHSGLGLSISRKIIESFDGTINLIKNPHTGFEGACFEIKLPLKAL
jgi:signal transduction histidine kinase